MIRYCDLGGQCVGAPSIWWGLPFYFNSIFLHQNGRRRRKKTLFVEFRHSRRNSNSNFWWILKVSKMYLKFSWSEFWSFSKKLKSTTCLHSFCLFVSHAPASFTIYSMCAMVCELCLSVFYSARYTIAPSFSYRNPINCAAHWTTHTSNHHTFTHSILLARMRCKPYIRGPYPTKLSSITRMHIRIPACVVVEERHVVYK